MNISDSNKLLLVKHLLQNCVQLNLEKVVIVSYHTKTLDILQKLCIELSLQYLRLDCSTTIIEPGGVGLNLFGASRLILYDIDWNPAIDAHASLHSRREGQQRDVHIYRLITAGCIEEKIFQKLKLKTNLGVFLAPKENNVNSAGFMEFSYEEFKDLFQIQYDYNFCKKHQIFSCKCLGNGQNLNTVNELPANIIQLNELNFWKHWKPNTDETLLKETNLWDAKNELVYIFSNTTVNNNQ